MLQPVPTRVDDAKDAVLWSLFDRLQKIDENAGSRLAFGASIVYNAQIGLNDPVFTSELEQLREILKIVPLTEEVSKEVEAREFSEPTAEMTMRDL